MRITTQMLNESARKAGLPIHQGSLLDYINKSDSGSASLLNALQTKAAGATSRTKYEKQEKAADELLGQVQRSFYEKYEGEGEDSGFYKSAQALAEKYNRLLSELKSSPDVLDSFYRQSLGEIVSSGKASLDAVGITAAKDGKLKVDSDKLKSASPEELREVFGEKSEFMEKLQFLAGRISDRAGANAKSASASYSPDGMMNYYSQNKYDFWG